MPTWKGDGKHADDHEFDVLMFERGWNPRDDFPVPRLISGLTGRAREHLRVAGDLDPFVVDGRLEQFLEHFKKNGCSSTTRGGNGIQEAHVRNQTCEGESVTSWIDRSDEALMDMRKKLASAPSASSSQTTMVPPQIQGWLLLHRARLRSQKFLLDLFTDDVRQSVDPSHGKDSGNSRKQHAFVATEEFPEEKDGPHLTEDDSDEDDL